MKHRVSLEDISIFFLVAVIAWSLVGFTSGISDNIKINNALQSAGLFTIGNTPQPTSRTSPLNETLVTLVASPGIVQAGDDVTISWNVSQNMSVCVAGSNPLQSGWSGDKSATNGGHSQVITSDGTDTIISIRCLHNHGRVGVASMSLIGN